MRRIRVIPTLLMRNGGLVKTTRFGKAVYVGDPVNTLRILNEKEVDEVVVLDIDASRTGSAPDVARIRRLAGECFMPLTYGGGISSVDQIHTILAAGVEKVVLNSACATAPGLITDAARRFGSQAVVVAVDVRRRWWLGHRTYTHAGTRALGMTPAEAARRAEQMGAGEILLTSIDREGTYLGYDLDLVRPVCAAVSVPVIANGGARAVDDFPRAVAAGASAVAASSMFMFQGPHRAVLVSYPEYGALRNVFAGWEHRT